MRRAARFLALVPLLLCAGAPDMPAAQYDRDADQHGFTVFMEEGGWCWFQDPRAIVHDGILYMGSVKGSGDGEALVGAFDLDTGERLASFVAHRGFDRDDHNSPVFFARADGSLLTTYARHNRSPFHYSRILPAGQRNDWGPEFKHRRKGRTKKDNVTYMNLYEMKSEGLLYNFYRGLDFNPTYVTSKDGGTTWSDPVHFFRNEVGGRHRPYARYTGDGVDTVCVSVTDAHPRNHGNSIYYFEFRDGKYWKADGSLIRALEDGGPLLPSEAEKIYQGSAAGLKVGDSVPGAAWTSSIALDQQGHVHIGYTLHLTGNDHRYRLASWDGEKWIDREVAHAGTCLYSHESSYTGLISLDPVDPAVVFISTDVHPATGEPMGGRHEIFRARIGVEDTLASVKWTAVTQGSPVRNIRPVILRENGKRIVMWNRGEFQTYLNYQLDTVGLIEEVGQMIEQQEGGLE